MELLDRDNVSVTSRDNWLRIKRSDPSLIWLTVTSVLVPKSSHNKIIEDSEIGELGRDIGKNPQLRGLYICFTSSQHFQLLCEGFHRNRSIEYVCWDSSGWLGREMFQLLTPFLESNNNLQSMGFNMHPLDREGMPSLMAHLMRRRRPLKRLDLQWNGITDDWVEGLAMGVRENPALCPKTINLSCNHIGETGCGLIATLLQDPRCRIEKLNFYGGGGGDTSAKLLADSLVGNTTLRVLQLGSRGITATGLRAMSRLFCNTTNINTTYSSNHTLQNFTFRSDENVDDLHLYLVWNANENKKMVARQKVFMKHFIQNFKMEPFEKMEPDLLVHVLGFAQRASMENGGVANANAHNSIVYQLIKNNPTVLRDIAKTGPMTYPSSTSDIGCGANNPFLWWRRLLLLLLLLLLVLFNLKASSIIILHQTSSALEVAADTKAKVAITIQEMKRLVVAFGNHGNILGGLGFEFTSACFSLHHARHVLAALVVISVWNVTLGGPKKKLYF